MHRKHVAAISVVYSRRHLVDDGKGAALRRRSPCLGELNVVLIRVIYFVKASELWQGQRPSNLPLGATCGIFRGAVRSHSVRLLLRLLPTLLLLLLRLALPSAIELFLRHALSLQQLRSTLDSAIATDGAWRGHFPGHVDDDARVAFIICR